MGTDAQPFMRNHVVMLIHGIRTHGEWQTRAAAILESDPDIIVRSAGYPFLDIFRFLLPFSAFRQRPIKRILDQIRDEQSKYDGPFRLSIIAHSFGTYIVSKILEQDHHIKFHRLILCGSIIQNAFEWDRYGHRIAPGDWQIVNDCGKRDPWPVLAESITWGYGSSGRFGFRHGRVKDRFHGVGHSGFFESDFIKKYWLPFLSSGIVIEGDLDRPAESWWLSVLGVLKIRYLALALLATAIPAGAWTVYLRVSDADTTQTPGADGTSDTPIVGPIDAVDRREREFRTTFEGFGSPGIFGSNKFLPADETFEQYTPINDKFTFPRPSTVSHSGRYAVNFAPDGNPITEPEETHGAIGATVAVSAAILDVLFDVSDSRSLDINYFVLSTSEPRPPSVHGCDSSLAIFAKRDTHPWKHFTSACGSHKDAGGHWGEQNFSVPTEGAKTMKLAFVYQLQNSEEEDPNAMYLIDDLHVRASSGDALVD